MLPDRLYQLLTGYVDGELSPRQGKTVLRLLRKSPEARDLLRQLQQDAQSVQSLLRPKLPADFASQVVGTIARRGLHPARSTAATAAKTPPAWIGWTVAAAVLLAVTAGSYLFFSKRPANSDTSETPLVADVEKKLPAVGPGKSDGATQNSSGNTKPEQPNTDNKNKFPTPPATKKQDGGLGEFFAMLFPPRDPKKVGPGDPPSDVVTIDGGANPEKMFSIENPKLSLYLPLRKLHEKEWQGDLAKRLEREKSCRLQLFCRDNVKAVGRLKNALKGNGVQLVIDPQAQAALKKTAPQTRFVLYTENLTSEELGKILHQLNKEDRNAEGKRKGDGQFGELIVSSLAENNRLALARMLGLDVKELRAPKKKEPAQTNLRVPLSKGTEDHVFLSLQGLGPSRQAPGQAAPKRLAVLLVYHPNEALRPSKSNEVKNFLLARAGRPKTMQVVLVLQQGPVS
jgi:hypothetical protein